MTVRCGEPECERCVRTVMGDGGLEKSRLPDGDVLMTTGGCTPGIVPGTPPGVTTIVGCCGGGLRLCERLGCTMTCGEWVRLGDRE